MPVMQDGKEIRFLFLPDGEDPDTQVRKIGKEAFEEKYKQAASLNAYFIENLHERFNISSDEGKARFIQEAAKLLQLMPDTLVKDQLILRLSKHTNIEESILRKRNLATTLNSEQMSISNENNKVSRISNREVRQTPIRYAISLVLTEPSLIKLVNNIEEIALSKLPGSDLLTTLIEALQENPDIKPIALLERWKNTEFEAPLMQLMKWQPESESSEILETEFLDCLKQIRKRSLESNIEELLHVARTKDFDELTETEKQAIQASLKNRN